MDGPSTPERGRRSVRPQAQAFGLRHGGPPAPTRRSTRPPVWRCAMRGRRRAAVAQRVACGRYL